MTDPKPYTVEEATMSNGFVDRILVDSERLLATAQAAAEADSLRAQLAKAVEHATDEEAQKWTAITRAEKAEAAITAAQGEVVVLREALLTACSWAQCPIEEEGVKGEWVEDVKKIRAAFASTRASADAHDERVRRAALESAEADIRRIANEIPGSPTAGLYRAAEHLRALAHPTKEPK